MRQMILALVLSLHALTGPTAPISSIIDVTDNEISLNFPESATFRGTFTASPDITSVVLEYGDEQQTCGDVIAKAFPQITPGSTVDAEWTWEMRQSGSLPPGAQIWWRWRLTDPSGVETVTETQTATWLDDTHPWKTVQDGDHLRLHWYEGDAAFAADMASAARRGLLFNEEQAGLKAEAPIDLYIYADTDDLRDAILYEPSWTGGQAFPDYNIVILGISQSQLDWGRDAIVHELTHVLVGDLTFSCLGDVPTWLNEGLAVYSEGELDTASREQLDEAIRADTLLSIRSLSGSFSEIPDRAYLSYSQSQSIAKFLIETHGQDRMTELLEALRDGLTVDQALEQTYGFNIEGLEDEWRASIGAQPQVVSAQPTAQPTPTFVPTFVPVAGAPGASQSTPGAESTPTPGLPPGEDAPAGGPPLALTLILLGICCVMLLIFGIVILGVIVRRQHRNEGPNVE